VAGDLPARFSEAHEYDAVELLLPEGGW